MITWPNKKSAALTLAAATTHGRTMLRKIQRIHFVGIGGIGMSGIAELLLNLGYQVSGSDMRKGTNTARLETLGGKISAGHGPEQVTGADVVVYSSAVGTDNVEIVEARRQQIPVIPRAEMLAELMRLKYGIAVAGSHGKTSTTSMIATVLVEGHYDPTAVIGGRLNALGSNAKLGQGDFIVAEADESDGSFLKLTPTIAVITNIDREHLDHYSNLEAIRDAFVDFANKVPFYGSVVLCHDDPNARAIIPRLERRIISYGIDGGDLCASELEFRDFASSFLVSYHKKPLGPVHLQIPGQHGALNALASIAVGLELEVPFDAIANALAGFQNADRRFQIKGEKSGVLVVDDYGHHPTEITATLNAARMSCHGRLIAVFQPHRFTRTQALGEEFASAFDDADALFVLPIYPAGEAEIPGVSGEGLAEKIRNASCPDVTYIAGIDAAVAALRKKVRKGDLVITLGAGDVWKISEGFLR